MTDAEADAARPPTGTTGALDLPTPVRALADLNTHDASVLDVALHPAANTLRSASAAATSRPATSTRC